MRETIDRNGLDDHVTLAGAVDDAALAAHYHGADIFVSASLYEGYGMVLAEAMARGLPMVISTGGAAAQTAPDDAALKVPPGDATALAGALSRIIDDEALCRRLAGASTRAGAALPRWHDYARIVAKRSQGYQCMTGFFADWLSLRESAITRRATALSVDKLAEASSPRAGRAAPRQRRESFDPLLRHGLEPARHPPALAFSASRTGVFRRSRRRAARGRRAEAPPPPGPTRPCVDGRLRLELVKV